MLLKEMRDKIEYAVNKVYGYTDDGFIPESILTIDISVPGYVGNRKEIIRVARTVRKNDLYYKLYIRNAGEDPFLTVFGCWPKEFVIDIFVRTLQHYFDLYD